MIMIYGSLYPSMDAINSSQLDLYLSLFQGRAETCAKRWERKERSGYSPYNVDFTHWQEFLANGGRSITDYPHKALIPYNNQVLASHLSGRETIGIYPLLDNNTSYFIVADFDAG